MKAMVMQSTGSDVSPEDRQRPEPGVDEVLIRVRACGVCHSDLAVQQGAFPFAEFPLIPGHEVAGVVEEVGQNVEWPEKGQRVGMPWLNDSCGHCEQCTAGDEVLCNEVMVTGVNRDGGYAEYMIAPASYTVPIPDALSDSEAGPLMCAGLTVHNGLKRAGFKPGEKVAVIGLGGLGHLAVLYAKAMGARVAVLSGSPDKEGEARELGAERFVNTKEKGIAEALQQWDGGADIVLATSPSGALMSQAVNGLAQDGRLVVLGAAGDEIQAAPAALIMGRRKIMGVPSGSRRDARDALSFAASHDIRPRVTERPLEEANDVLKEMEQGSLRDRVVLTFG
jgi:D-arabinose 1-dehydrogenase-like Zn-dependent alcohol dehydrogenase